ncbi:MAG: hypothetical protein JJE40_18835 [Vicinamibacteria bacterium]|nr:hypothetical protein [Vicinamibacteria bacterium]
MRITSLETLTLHRAITVHAGAISWLWVRVHTDEGLIDGYWNLPSAVAIARALEPYRPMWLEDALPQDNLDAYARLKDETSLPLVLSERLMTRWQSPEVLERGLAQCVNPDPCWCGGLTEALAIATLAGTAYVPVAPHNCGGPVLHAACVHLATAIPDLFILESVRRHYQQDHRDVVVSTRTDASRPLSGRRAGCPAAVSCGHQRVADWKDHAVACGANRQRGTRASWPGYRRLRDRVRDACDRHDLREPTLCDAGDGRVVLRQRHVHARLVDGLHGSGRALRRHALRLHEHDGHGGRAAGALHHPHHPRLGRRQLGRPHPGDCRRLLRRRDRLARHRPGDAAGRRGVT